MTKQKAFIKMTLTFILLFSFIGTSSIQASEISTVTDSETERVLQDSRTETNEEAGTNTVVVQPEVEAEKASARSEEDQQEKNEKDEKKASEADAQASDKDASEKKEDETNKEPANPEPVQYWGYDEGSFDENGAGHNTLSYVMIKAGIPYAEGIGEIVYCLNENRDAPSGLRHGSLARIPVQSFIQRNFREEDIKAYLDEERDFDVKSKLSQVILAGYDNNAKNFKGSLSDYEFRLATQEAIWHYTKSNYSSNLMGAAQSVYEKLIGEENDIEIPKDFNLVLYEYIGKETVNGHPRYQNFLGSKILHERISIEPKVPDEIKPEGPKENNPKEPKEENPKEPKEENPKEPKEENPKGPKEENPKGPKEENPKGPKEDNPKEPKKDNPEEPKGEKPNTEKPQPEGPKEETPNPETPKAERPHSGGGGGHSSWSGNRPKTEEYQDSEKPSKEVVIPKEPEQEPTPEKETPVLEVKKEVPVPQNPKPVTTTPRLPKTGTTDFPFMVIFGGLGLGALLNNRKLFKK